MTNFSHKKIVSLRHIEGKDFGSFERATQDGKTETVAYDNVQIVTYDPSNEDWEGGCYETTKIPFELLQMSLPSLKHDTLGQIIGKYMYTICSIMQKKAKDGSVYQAATINAVMLSNEPLPIGCPSVPAGVATDETVGIDDTPF